MSVERIADGDGEEQLFKKEEKEEEFRTGTLPTRPLLTVNPESGIMYETEFSIELKGSPGEELSYIVLGVLADESEIRLTDEYAALDENGQGSVTRPLPQLSKIKVEVKNNFGEVTYVQTEVGVNKQEGIQWIKIFQAQGGGGSADQVWQQYQFIASDANSDARAISKRAGSTEEQRTASALDARQVN